MNLIILDEDMDENYEPTREEIIEYASYLGMSPRTDAKYFKIAIEGLKTPLPYPWKPAKSPDGNLYYYNQQSKEISEDHPLDEHFRRQFIEAKKKDTQNSTSKISKKLKNLCSQTREETQDLEESQYNDLLIEYQNQANKQFEQYQAKSKLEFEQRSQEVGMTEGTKVSDLDFAQKAKQLRSQFKAKKEELRIKISEEFEEDYKFELAKLQEEQQEHIEREVATQEQSLNSRISQLQESLNAKLMQQQSKIQKIQTELEEQKVRKQQAVEKNKDLLDNKWIKLKPTIEYQLMREQNSQLTKMKYQHDSNMAEAQNSFKQQLIKQKLKLQEHYQQDHGARRRGFLRILQKERIQLLETNLEQEMQQEISEEKMYLDKQLLEVLQTYEEQVRAYRVVIKQQKVQKDRLVQQRFYAESLAYYKQESLKQLELEFNKLDLEQSIIINQNYVKQQSSNQPPLNYEQISEKVQLEQQINSYNKQLQQLHSQIECLTILMQDRELVANLSGQANRTGFLQRTLQERNNELQHLMNMINNDSEPQLSFHPTNKDQWLEQIDQEKNWLRLQKERLKYDKKSIRKAHDKLQLMNMQTKQVDDYNKSVDIVRHTQTLMQNCEYIIKKLEYNLQNYYKTKMIEYLKENDNQYEDLHKFKEQIAQLPQLPIDNDYLYSSYKVKSSSFHVQSTTKTQLDMFLTTQKQVLKGIKDNLNQSMYSRMN